MAEEGNEEAKKDDFECVLKSKDFGKNFQIDEIIYTPALVPEGDHLHVLIL